VNGDLVLETGSRLAVEVNPQGIESDLVTVTGRATINGGGVAHIGVGGNYGLRSTYTILSASELNGAFEGVTSDFAFVTPDLIYDYGAGTVDLELRRNDRDFASAASTRNQIAIADGIESIGFNSGHTVYDAIALLGNDTNVILASFDALLGEIHASARTALIQDSQFVRNTANDRLRAALGSAGATMTPVLAFGPGSTPIVVAADHTGPAFWSHAFGSGGQAESDGNAAGLDRHTGGLLIGTDGLLGDWRIGLLAGYSRSSFQADDRASSGLSDNYHLGLYGGVQWGDLTLHTGAAYTLRDLSTSRAVVIPGIAESLTARYNAGTFQAFGELGYGFDLGTGSRLEPFANVAYVTLHSDRFAEAGGNAALSGGKDNSGVVFTTLGLRGEHAVTLGTIGATVKGMLGWQHAYGDATPTSTHAFSAGDAFSIAGSPIGRDALVLNAGLDLNPAPDVTLGLSYQGQFSSGAQDHGFKANLAIRF